RHSKRFNFLTEGGYIFVPFSGIGIRRSYSATLFYHWDSEGPEAQMIIGSPNVQHPVHFLSNPNQTGAVQVRTPDGILLQSTPVDIGLYDVASATTAIVGAAEGCSAALLGQPDGVPHLLPFPCPLMKITAPSLVRATLLAGSASVR